MVSRVPVPTRHVLGGGASDAMVSRVPVATRHVLGGGTSDAMVSRVPVPTPNVLGGGALLHRIPWQHGSNMAKQQNVMPISQSLIW